MSNAIQFFLNHLPGTLLCMLLIWLILFFFVYAWTAAAAPAPVKKKGRKGAKAAPPRLPLTFQERRHPMEKKDALPLLGVTALYAATAFFGLGNLSSPQSFQTFSQSDMVSFSLAEPVVLSRIQYFGGLSTGNYSLYTSSSGETWNEITLEQPYTNVFYWREAALDPAGEPVQYFRLKADNTALELGEIALYDAQGAMVTSVQDGGALFDEQDTVPDAMSFMNSAYFDEIYHPRTAYEHLKGIFPYEITHPPLGKLIISVGIWLFGLSPFGWRFMGTLFGVLMVPILYVFLKNLFGKTQLALLGSAMFAFEFMHFVQTRIATIDTYGVFFILLAYFFLYRYFTAPSGGSIWNELVPLGLSGLSFGLGAASKWTVFYAAAGMALLYFWNLVLRWRSWGKKPGLSRWVTVTLAWSVLCFVAVPLVIYILSYLPYAASDPQGGSLLKVCWDNQRYMLGYHKGVSQSHPYSARWWQWVIDAKPILYYLDNSRASEGLKTAFGAFGTPAIVWGGLLAELTLAAAAIRRRSGRAVFLLVGYLAQLLPWVFITRTTFPYHYFPSILFLVLAITYVMNELLDSNRAYGKWAVYGFAGVSLALFPLFYPVLAGMTVPDWYGTNLLKWFPSWPF